MRDRAIVSSLLEADFYKFTMLQMILKYHPDVPVEFSFINRTKSVQLAKAIDLGELREHLDHCRDLTFTSQELHYLMGTYEYEQPMFRYDFVQRLQFLRLSEFSLSQTTSGQLDLRFFGPWAAATLWETLALSIVNELYFASLMKGMSRFERQVVEAEGRRRLAEKIRMLRQFPGVMFSEFGNRRAFSRAWEGYVVGVFKEELPLQFRGTSNTWLAQKYGVMPMGTNAHEPPMVYSGIYHDQDDEDPVFSQRRVLDDWESLYVGGLLLFLPDTWSSDWFFDKVATVDRLRKWRGSRQDSGNPIMYARKRIGNYQAAGIDPREKLIVFADGLDVQKMCGLNTALTGKIQDGYGWGTNATNDLGFNPISIVVKATKAAGHPVIKLSDNIEKATGDPAEIERVKRLIGYDVTLAEACKY